MIIPTQFFCYFKSNAKSCLITRCKHTTKFEIPKYPLQSIFYITTTFYFIRLYFFNIHITYLINDMIFQDEGKKVF